MRDLGLEELLAEEACPIIGMCDLTGLLWEAHDATGEDSDEIYQVAGGAIEPVVQAMWEASMLEWAK